MRLAKTEFKSNDCTEIASKPVGIFRRPLQVIHATDAVGLFMDTSDREPEFIPAADAHDMTADLANPTDVHYLRIYSM